MVRRGSYDTRASRSERSFRAVDDYNVEPIPVYSRERVYVLLARNIHAPAE